ncbi:hypothetical protein LSUB1_G003867, partial [Lachnellula subtilissima]
LKTICQLLLSKTNSQTRFQHVFPSYPHCWGRSGWLALGQNLKKKGMSFTLFESDASPSVRAQGYRIRIAGGGAEGLRECLDDKLFSLFETTCAETKPPTEGGRFNAMNADSMESLFPNGATAGIAKGLGPAEGPPGKPKMGGPGVFSKPYTVDRTMLRNVLLLGQEDHVKFNKSFTHYETTFTGVTAFLSDGTSERGTLLLLPNIRYVDTLSRVIIGKTPFTEELIAPLKWMTAIQDQSLTLFMEPVRFPKDTSVETNGRVLGGNAETFGLSDSEFHNLSGKDVADLILKLTSHWDPSFKAIFELHNTAQGAPLRLSPSANVVLMGDAIHAMMPAGGSGANTALGDASLLGRIIAKKGVSEGSMTTFVDQMWEYALPAIKGSLEAGKKLLGFKGFESSKEVTI